MKMFDSISHSLSSVWKRKKTMFHLQLINKTYLNMSSHIFHTVFSFEALVKNLEKDFCCVQNIAEGKCELCLILWDSKI